MPARLPLLTVLLLLAGLLLAAAAHGAPAASTVPTLEALAFEEPFEAEAEEEGGSEGEEAETSCDTAYEEADKGELGYDEAEEICEEEEDEARPAARHHPTQPRHGAHRHKKACRKRAARKRHCKKHRG